MPWGAETDIVAAALLYQATLPAVPASTLIVETAKLAVPAKPLARDPDWEPRLAAGTFTRHSALTALSGS